MGQLRRLGRLARFSGWFTWQLVLSNVQVTWDVLTPRSRLRPGVVALPLRCRTDAEVTLLSNLITLTPGTLTLAIRKEPATMYVHGMYAADAEVFRGELGEMQERMLRAVRREVDR